MSLDTLRDAQEALIRERDREADERMGRPAKDPLVCPECGSTDLHRDHYDGDPACPECDYWKCETCEHQWGHE